MQLFFKLADVIEQRDDVGLDGYYWMDILTCAQLYRTNQAGAFSKADVGHFDMACKAIKDLSCNCGGFGSPRCLCEPPVHVELARTELLGIMVIECQCIVGLVQAPLAC